MTRASTRRLTAIDLFSGCGGMTVGLKRAGFAVVGAVELKRLAVEAYKLNHPEVHVWHNDICDITGQKINRALRMRKGELDLLVGCPPCQGFSRLRTLNGNARIKDPRNDLVFEFLRIVEELHPRAVMMENVPGLASDRRLHRLVAGLKALRYSCEHRILDAAQYGVPQRRKRLILLACKRGSIPFSAPARKRPTVRSVIGDLLPSGCSGDAIHDFPEQRTDRIAKLIANIPKDGGSRDDLPAKYMLACHKRCRGFFDVYGRMAWDDVSPTITSGCVNPSKGRFLHPELDRTVTIREAALLQTFPKRYKFPSEQGKFPLAELIGNAIPPEFIRRHALSIKRHIQAHW